MTNSTSAHHKGQANHSDRGAIPSPGVMGNDGTGPNEIDPVNPLVATELIYRWDENQQQQQEAQDESDAEGDGEEGEDQEDAWKWSASLPWYRRPSEKWLRPMAFLIAISAGMGIPPKLEFYDQLACEEIYFRNATSLATNNAWLASSPHHTNSSLVTPRPIDTGFNSHQAPVHAVYFSLRGEKLNSEPEASAGPRIPNGPGEEDDALCHSPPVLAGSAELQMKLTITTGLLSVLTTGWWAGLSDRRGRTWILRFAALGLTINDLVLLITAHFPRASLPFGNHFLLIGAVLEGLVGGYPTLGAAHQAYIADSTPSGTRAQVFSFFMGLLFAGIAVGPTLGGWLVARTGSLMTVFYVATIVHAVYLLFATLVLPESTSPESRMKAKSDQENARRKWEEQFDYTHERSGWFTKRVARSWAQAKVPFEPLRMLLPRRIELGEAPTAAAAASVAADEEETISTSAYSERTPLLSVNNSTAGSKGVKRRVSYSDQLRAAANGNEEAGQSHISVSHVGKCTPSATRRRLRSSYDVNLFLLAMAYFFETMIIGSMMPKMLYAQQIFNWGASEVGSFMTLASLTRVLCLMLVLPLVIKLVHRPKKYLVLPQDAGHAGTSLLDEEGRPRKNKQGETVSSAALATASSSSSSSSDDDAPQPVLAPTASMTQHERSVEELWTLRAKHLRMLHDSRFDLGLARWSVVIMMVCYAFLPLASTAWQFVVLVCLTSLGGGGSAAMSSLSLSLLRNPRDAGKLFGAMSVTNAIGQTVLGPFLFTWVFRQTANTRYPYFLFIVAFLLFLVAFILLSLVRVRKTKSLPSLPPRPHASSAATIPTEPQSPALPPGSPDTLGPVSSTRSKFRMKAHTSVDQVFARPAASSPSA